jgi:shikimate dehydrogenase
MMIDGSTRLYAILGDPVAQVRSPSVYTTRFAEAGLNAVLFPAQADAGNFDAAIRGLMALSNLDGLLFTSPHKSAAVWFANCLSKRANTVGAVNAMRREVDGTWFGDMFDGVGFARATKRLQAIRGVRARVFGCGGAGAAIAAELAAEGARSIALIDPDATRARHLRDTLIQNFPDCDVILGYDGAGQDFVINASVVGMKDGDGLPGDLGELDGNSLVGDVVLRPPERPTELVKQAQAAGSRIVTGKDMHSGQIEAILSFFARKDEPIEHAENVR